MLEKCLCRRLLLPPLFLSHPEGMAGLEREWSFSLVEVTGESEREWRRGYRIRYGFMLGQKKLARVYLEQVYP